MQQPPSANARGQSSEADDFAPPDVATIQKLDAMATEKLAEIVRRSSAQEVGWQGYDAGEVAAVKELLAASSSTAEK